MTQSNPLLTESQLFDGAIPFTEIKIEHYLPALQVAIEEAKNNLNRIRNQSDAPNFENTIVALELATEMADKVGLIYGNLEICNGDDEFHKIAQELYPLLTALSSDVALDPVLFGKVKSVYEQKNNLNLNSEQVRLLEKTYLSFVRNGALLSDHDKEKLRKIDQELSVLAPKFSENVLKATNQFQMWIDDKNDLDGLPESAIEAAALAAKNKGEEGKWLFTLQMPSYLPFLTYSKKRHLREKLWRASGSRAYQSEFDNQDLIKKTIQLRYDRAQILGYETHAHFILEERMAKTPSAVFQFLDQLLAASKNAGMKDLEELKAFARSEDQIDEIKPWDISYYSEKLKEKKYKFNDEELRPYFQLEKVIAGVFDHAQKLYGLEFKENNQIPVYHSEVKVYEVYESATKRYMGLFYTDFFPRETKKGGAWMTQYRSQGLSNGKIQRPHVSIVCNFTKPTPNKPSLITYDEVKTLFHEFGHALHGMLSDCTYQSLSGPNVFWDFVELPSQIFENWVDEKEGLNLYARHFETGELMPDSLIEKIRESKKFMAGWFSCRQLGLGYLDMAWHTTNPANVVDVAEFERQATQKTALLTPEKGINVSCSFSHIFSGGYSAGYYSYKWAEVLDADAFEFFLENGIFNIEIANKFKENILSRGSTEHPMELYKKFRGREPDPNALLRRDGLIQQ